MSNLFIWQRWGVVDEPTGAQSWVFRDDEIGGVRSNDALNGCKVITTRRSTNTVRIASRVTDHRSAACPSMQSMRELYELNDPKYADRYTVPVLWDSQTKKIVNNESSEIIRMFNTEFNAFAKVNSCRCYLLLFIINVFFLYIFYLIASLSFDY